MTDDGVRSLIERVRTAINRHDLDAFLECFDQAYESEQPLEPERSFRGRDRVRRNWSANWHAFPIFAGICSTPVSPLSGAAPSSAVPQSPVSEPTGASAPWPPTSPSPATSSCSRRAA